MNYLISKTEVYRVPTVEAVEELHTKLKNDPNFELEGFAYKTKFLKQKGEIIDEWQLVTVKKKYNDEKDPLYGIEEETND